MLQTSNLAVLLIFSCSFYFWYSQSPIGHMTHCCKRPKLHVNGRFGVLINLKSLPVSQQFAVLLAIIFILEIAAGALAYAFKNKVWLCVLFSKKVSSF